jgi:hypothetical protein
MGMCSTPDVPTVPQRQAAKAPDAGDASVATDANARKRLAYASTILTTPTGLGAPSTTGSTTLG